MSDPLIQSAKQSPLMNLLTGDKGSLQSWVYAVKKAHKIHSKRQVFIPANTVAPGDVMSFKLPRLGLTTAIFLRLTVEADANNYQIPGHAASAKHATNQFVHQNFLSLFEHIVLESHGREIERITPTIIWSKMLSGQHAATQSSSGSGWTGVDGSTGQLTSVYHEDGDKKYFSVLIKVDLSFFGSLQDGNAISSSQDLSFLEQLTISVRLADTIPGQNRLFNANPVINNTANGELAGNKIYLKNSSGLDFWGREVPGTGLLVMYSQFASAVTTQLQRSKYAARGGGSGPRTFLLSSVYTETPVRCAPDTVYNSSKQHKLIVPITSKNVIFQTIIALRNEHQSSLPRPGNQTTSPQEDHHSRALSYTSWGDLHRIAKVSLYCNGIMYRSWNNDEAIVENCLVDTNGLIPAPEFHSRENLFCIKWHTKPLPLSAPSGAISLRNVSAPELHIEWVNPKPPGSPTTDFAAAGPENAAPMDYANKHTCDFRCHVYHRYYNVVSVDPSSGSVLSSLSI